MFIEPIKHTPLTDIEELKKFSYLTQGKATPKTYCTNNGQCAFTDSWGNVSVTPLRAEVTSILKNAGYTESSFFVPFSNGEERPLAYQWLEKMALRQYWAELHERALLKASEKGIFTVNNLDLKNVWIKEITTYHIDRQDCMSYHPIVQSFADIDKVGTYIIVDEKTLVVCDEYGRTFLLKTQKIINEIVNYLISSMYTEAPHPEFYVEPYHVKEEEKTGTDEKVKEE